MRKLTALFLTLLLTVSMAACGGRTAEADVYRKDTVIYIPAEPTETQTEAVEETETEFTEPDEPETSEETVPETTQAATSKKPASSSSSGKKPSSGSSSQKETTATTAPAEEPATEETTEETMMSEETTPPLYDISGYTVGSLERAMMDEINSLRAAEGLEALNQNSYLCAIAAARAYEGSFSWSHTRPDGSYYTTVFRDYGFSCGSSAENLIGTSGGEDAATLISRWMGSEGNRNNLMNAGFTTVGIGVYNDNGNIYIACLLTG